MEKFWRLQRLLYFNAVFFAMFLLLAPAAEATEVEGQQIVVVVDGVTPEELLAEDMVYTNKLVQQGALGLINTGTAGKPNSENAYLTLGAGKKALANPWSGLAFRATELINNESVRSGSALPDKKELQPENIVNLNIQELIKTNAQTPYGAVPGLLGNVLREMGITTVALGSTDKGTRPHSLATLITMDGKGVTTEGQIDGGLTVFKHGGLPERVTDYSKLLSAFKQHQDKPGLVVIETGDIYRLNGDFSTYPINVWQQARRFGLQQIDSFIGELTSNIDFSTDRLIIITPSPSPTSQKGDIITPCIMVGKDISGGTLIFSNSTRKEGLAILPDFAPTLVGFWDGEIKENSNGRPLQFVAKSNAKEYILTYHQRLKEGYWQRGWILVPVCLLWIAGVLTFAYRMYKPARTSKVIQQVPVFLALLPLSLLWVAIAPVHSLFLKLLIIMFIAGVITCLITRLLPTPNQRMVAVSFITAFAVLMEVISGGSLSQYSPLGYDLIIGGRYYGLGNEFMGILVAACVLGVTLAHDEKIAGSILRSGTFLIFTLTTFSLALPSMGADAGGAVTAVVTFGIAAMKLRRQAIGWKQVLYLCGGVIAVIGLITSIDLTKALAQSTHIGKAFLALWQGDFVELQRIINRKLVMNLTVLKFTGGSLLLWVIAFCYLVYRPVGWLKDLMMERPGFEAGMIGAATGCIVAFIFNDTGAVAAACMLAFLTPVVMYLSTQVTGGDKHGL